MKKICWVRASEIVSGILMLLLLCSFSMYASAEGVKRIPLKLKPTDVIPNGNEWISLPTIRASDGALVNFNVLSMHDKGLLQVEGDNGSPAIQPYIAEGNKLLPIDNVQWELIEYWIPMAHFSTDGVDVEITYCAPPHVRGALIEMKVTNRRATEASINFGVKALWGGLSRVTYTACSVAW